MAVNHNWEGFDATGNLFDCSVTCLPGIVCKYVVNFPGLALKTVFAALCGACYTIITLVSVLYV